MGNTTNVKGGYTGGSDGDGIGVDALDLWVLTGRSRRNGCAVVLLRQAVQVVDGSASLHIGLQGGLTNDSAYG